MGTHAPLTTWTQLLLVPPSSIRVQLDCTVHGPTSTITYTVIVTDPETTEEVAAHTHVSWSESVLPAIAVDMLREQLAAARVSVSPF